MDFPLNLGYLDLVKTGYYNGIYTSVGLSLYFGDWLSRMGGEVVVSTLLLMVSKKIKGKDQQKYYHESPSDICLILIISVIFAMWIGLNNPYKHTFNRTASQRAEKTWREKPENSEKM